MTSSSVFHTTMIDHTNSAGSTSANAHSNRNAVEARGGTEFYSCPRCGGHIPLPPSQRFQGIFEFVQDHLTRCTGTPLEEASSQQNSQPSTPLDLLIPIQPRRAWSAEDSRRKKLEEDTDAYDVGPHSVTCAGCHRPIRLNGTGRYYAANWNKHKMGCKNTHASNSGASKSMESKFNGRVAAFRVSKPDSHESQSHPSRTSIRGAPIPSSSSSQASTSESSNGDPYPPPTASPPLTQTVDASEYLKRWSDAYLIDRRNSTDSGSVTQRSHSLRRANSRSSPAPPSRRLSSSSTRSSPGSRALRKEGNEVRAAPYRYGLPSENSRGGARYPVSHAVSSQRTSPVIMPAAPLQSRPAGGTVEVEVMDDRPFIPARRPRPHSLPENNRRGSDDHRYFPSRVERDAESYYYSHEPYDRRDRSYPSTMGYNPRYVDPRDPLAHVTVVPLTSRRQPDNTEPLYSPRPHTPLSAPAHSATSPSLHAARNERKRKSMDDIFYADIESLRLPDLRYGDEYPQEEQPRYSLPPFKSLSLDLPPMGRYPPSSRADRSTAVPPFIVRGDEAVGDSSETTDDDSDLPLSLRAVRSPKAKYSHEDVDVDMEVATPRILTQHQVSEERLGPKLHPVWKWDGEGNPPFLASS